MSTSFMPTDAFMLTAEERDLLPSDSGVQWYAEHGWYLSKKLLTDAEADALSAASAQIRAGKRDRVSPLRPPNLASWEPSDGQVQRHNDYVHYESDDFARILRKPLIGAVAARLAGSSEIRIFQATLIYKPPVRDEETNLVPWHADRHYWQTGTAERMLTAFIPFHDCGEEMGTITIIDGSHRWKEPPGGDDSTRHFAQRDRGELDALLAETARFNGAEVTATPMVIPKGHMSFHHCRVYHGSGANRSGRPRRCVPLHMQDGENQCRRHLRPDGGTVVYNNDVLVRSTGAGTPDYADPEYCPVIWRA